MAFPAGAPDSLQYDAQHLVTRAGRGAEFDYDRHDVTRGITQATYHGITQTFDYDACYRLTYDSISVNGYGPRGDSLTYDAAGNRTGASGTYTYTASNAVRGRPATGGDSYAPGDSLIYDAAGNPVWWKNKTSAQYDSLRWDAENRLVRHRRYSSGGSLQFDVQYAYDGLGRRVERDDGTLTLYVWDGWNLLAETNSSGTALRRYTYHPGTLDVPLAVRNVGTGTTYYTHRDGQGNVYRLTTSAGATAAQYRYRAWGDRYNDSTEAFASPFTFKGREEDRTTGLIYMRHRYYSPRLERFVNEDPIGIGGGLNVFAFGRNSPVDAADPMGLCTRHHFTQWEGDVVKHEWDEYDMTGCASDFLGDLVDIQMAGYMFRWGFTGGPSMGCPPCNKVNRAVASLGATAGRSDSESSSSASCGVTVTGALGVLGGLGMRSNGPGGVSDSCGQHKGTNMPLEPILPHNRERFDKLGRAQRLTVILMPIVGGGWFLILAALNAPAWMDYSVLGAVAIGGLALFVLEVRRTLVFREDMHERMENGSIERER